MMGIGLELNSEPRLALWQGFSRRLRSSSQDGKPRDQRYKAFGPQCHGKVKPSIFCVTDLKDKFCCL